MTKFFACAAAAVLIAGPAVADDCGWNKSAQAPAPGFDAVAYQDYSGGAAQTVAASDALVYGAPVQHQATPYTPASYSAPVYQDSVVFSLD